MKKIQSYTRHLMVIFLLLFAALPTQAKPALALQTLEGKTIPLDSLKGKWVMIHYWASWCDVCIDELHTFNEFYKTYQDRVALFAVNMDEVSQAEQQQLSQQYQVQFPSLFQGHTPPFDGQELSVVPATLVFSPDGTVKSTYYGMQSLASLKIIIASQSPNDK